MRKLRYLPPLLLVAAVLAAPVSGSANSTSATLSYAGTAILVPGGAQVTLHYSCMPPSPGDLESLLDENGVLGFSPPVVANCDDKVHTVTVTVAGAFTPGTAAGEAIVNNTDVSSSAVIQQEVTIK